MTKKITKRLIAVVHAITSKEYAKYENCDKIAFLWECFKTTNENEALVTSLNEFNFDFADKLEDIIIMINESVVKESQPQCFEIISCLKNAFLDVLNQHLEVLRDVADRQVVRDIMLSPQNFRLKMFFVQLFTSSKENISSLDVGANVSLITAEMPYDMKEYVVNVILKLKIPTATRNIYPNLVTILNTARDNYRENPKYDVLVGYRIHIDAILQSNDITAIKLLNGDDISIYLSSAYGSTFGDIKDLIRSLNVVFNVKDKIISTINHSNFDQALRKALLDLQNLHPTQNIGQLFYDAGFKEIFLARNNTVSSSLNRENRRAASTVSHDNNSIIYLYTEIHKRFPGIIKDIGIGYFLSNLKSARTAEILWKVNGLDSKLNLESIDSYFDDEFFKKLHKIAKTSANNKAFNKAFLNELLDFALANEFYNMVYALVRKDNISQLNINQIKVLLDYMFFNSKDIDLSVFIKLSYIDIDNDNIFVWYCKKPNIAPVAELCAVLMYKNDYRLLTIAANILSNHDAIKHFILIMPNHTMLIAALIALFTVPKRYCPNIYEFFSEPTTLNWVFDDIFKQNITNARKYEQKQSLIDAIFKTQDEKLIATLNAELSKHVKRRKHRKHEDNEKPNNSRVKKTRIKDIPSQPTIVETNKKSDTNNKSGEIIWEDMMRNSINTPVKQKTFTKENDGKTEIEVRKENVNDISKVESEEFTFDVSGFLAENPDFIEAMPESFSASLYGMYGVSDNVKANEDSKNEDAKTEEDANARNYAAPRTKRT